MASGEPQSGGGESKAILPSSEIIDQASALEIYDTKGTKVTFGSLFHDKRTIVVFVRHFACGNCQNYVTELSKVPAASLEKANVGLVVIGCGEWSAIDFYTKTTGFTGAIYTDPSRELYRKLGMTTETTQTTPAGEQPKSYVRDGLAMITLKSIGRAIIRPSVIGNQGNIKQIGGDFIFGPGNQCSFASYMKHTEDHMEPKELFEAAGVEY